MYATLLDWAANKPAGFFPMRWLPIGGWFWAAAAGAAALPLAKSLAHLAAWLVTAIQTVRDGSSSESSAGRGSILVEEGPGGPAGANPSTQDTPESAGRLVKAVLLAPYWEELVFRGFLLTVLASHMPLWAAVVVSSLYFTWGHPVPLRARVYVFLGSLIMSAAYLRTGNLIPAMVVHAYNNLYNWLRDRASY